MSWVRALCASTAQVCHHSHADAAVHRASSRIGCEAAIPEQISSFARTLEIMMCA
jgi:hypothetical protein